MLPYDMTVGVGGGVEEGRCWMEEFSRIRGMLYNTTVKSIEYRV